MSTDTMTDKNNVLIIPVFQETWAKDETFKSVDQELSKNLSKKAKLVRFKAKRGETFESFGSLEQMGDVEVVIVGLGERKKLKIGKFQETIAQVLRTVASHKFSSAAILLSDRMDTDAFTLGKVLSEALYLSQYRFDKYKTVDTKESVKVENLDVLLQPQKNQSKKSFDTEYETLQQGVEAGRLISQGVYLTRDLINEPALHMSPEQIAREAGEIAKKSKGKLGIKVLDRKECEKLGMHSFLSVARGSDAQPQFIILHFKGTNKKAKKICLVGKTIIFDSGGLSIKPPKSMETMKMDMAGGATVLGIFNVLSKLTDTKNIGEVYGILPACENMISGRASRPGDIVKALNGKSIEILNTDAEGRLALADALSYAEKYLKPDMIVDLATLTGAIMVALGEDIAGLFSNNQKLTDEIVRAAKEENELLWEMPLHKEYIEKMKSPIADVKNIAGNGWGGSITAALFLNEFVEKTPWVHLDIAGAAFNEGKPKGITPVGATGWGVKTIVRWLRSLSTS